jgi:hypothetical protein
LCILNLDNYQLAKSCTNLSHSGLSWCPIQILLTGLVHSFPAAGPPLTPFPETCPWMTVVTLPKKFSYPHCPTHCHGQLTAMVYIWGTKSWSLLPQGGTRSAGAAQALEHLRDQLEAGSSLACIINWLFSLSYHIFLTSFTSGFFSVNYNASESQNSLPTAVYWNAYSKPILSWLLSICLHFLNKWKNGGIEILHFLLSHFWVTPWLFFACFFYWGMFASYWFLATLPIRDNNVIYILSVYFWSVFFFRFTLWCWLFCQLLCFEKPVLLIYYIHDSPLFPLFLFFFFFWVVVWNTQ